MLDVQSVADYFIRKPDAESGDLMTHLKLQKLLYYAQGWCLALVDEPLFEADIEAWTHGPVCREVFDRFKHKKWDPIVPDDCQSEPSSLPEKFTEVLDEVWDVYGKFTAKRLEDMTHEDTPWKDHYDPDAIPSCATIPIDEMKAYFSQLATSQNGA